MPSIYILRSTSWIPRCLESLSLPVSTLALNSYLLSTQRESPCLAFGISRPPVWTIEYLSLQSNSYVHPALCILPGLVLAHRSRTAKPKPGPVFLDLSPHSHLISFIPKSPANPRLIIVLDIVPRRGLAPPTDRGFPSFPHHGWSEYPSLQSTTIQDFLRAIEISDSASCLWVCWYLHFTPLQAQLIHLNTWLSSALSPSFPSSLHPPIRKKSV